MVQKDSRKSSSLVFLFSASALLLSLLQIGKWASKSAVITSLTGSTSQNVSTIITGHFSCDHNYTIEIMSFDPLVIYVNNFVTEQEIDHLLGVTKDTWEDSYVSHRRDDQYFSELDKEWRSSQSAIIETKDPVSECLKRRLTNILGNLQHIDTEPLQLVKYEGGEPFRMHQDWLHIPKNVTFNAQHRHRLHNRLITSFTYLEDDCTGGETYFPELVGVGSKADGDKFSRTETGKGLLVKPKRGNAVLWNNLFMNGTGDERLSHASLPVKSGRKIGMNLFSVYYLDTPIVGDGVADDSIHQQVQ
ncbi:hypothetical protein BO78DRAFT_419383 [Aspergillus sclerotiicarbonarius CBS 121057]|uniref:Prolyl 4-hydroxylase alpha subunit domain-containing protein n=1 Tax=Aspergillus sclerotiicarbonarius (strain CBS 121057 / IBT 28362) TaxID=1448318 RepID=A0A319EGG0_ASPSB|nr:hypothetical protein BO78DRAFT_419383 [Aspergillus sclerotiicarbonarius CBS 121057]